MTIHIDPTAPIHETLNDLSMTVEATELTVVVSPEQYRELEAEVVELRGVRFRVVAKA
jgi:hypothetical protein